MKRPERKAQIGNPGGRRGGVVELFIFARFHARERQEDAVEDALRNVVVPSRQEAGCLGIHAFRSTGDPRLFYVHSKWIDEAAFELHARLPHTMRFLERVEPLLDHQLENVTRMEVIF
ncbi:MAG: putative quinol monooxygenase [Candidatus Acidiferrales bacterium]